MSTPIFERFLSTPEMLAVFDGAQMVQAMLAFEAALARAEAAEGLVPEAAATVIAAACRAERFDLDALAADGASAGSIAIPLVRQLTAAVARQDPAAANWVHWGSTSQDTIDTAMVLLTRRALALVDGSVAALAAALLELAARHGDAVMLGRTLLQPAQVTSLSCKLVSWVAPLVRSRVRLRQAADAALQLQLGGAVGTLAVLGERGAAVARRMAEELGLALPPGAWHTQRDSWVALGCEVGVLCGSLGKIAQDLALLAQGEVAEMAEPAAGPQGQSRGGSSAMPNKRNPVAAMVALAAALRAPQRVAALLAAMPQQHERGLGNWQAELAEWPALFAAAHGSAEALATAAAGLEVDVARMRRNIEAQHGLVFAEALALRLAAHLGKPRAQALVAQWSRKAAGEHCELRDLALSTIGGEPELAGVDAAAVGEIFDIDAVAHQADAVARPQLTALREQLRALPPLQAGHSFYEAPE
jgi:3-carboxy-cis,cis-muconate cycloisomerase